MSFFGELERFLSEDLYPYRWPILGVVLIIGAGIAYFAYRKRWHVAAYRHPVVTAAVVIPLLAVTLPLGYYLGSPLFERSYLEEESPLQAAVLAQASAPTENEELLIAPTEMAEAPSPATTPAAPTPEPTPVLPRLTHQGEFHGADDFHFGRGNALLIETEPGVYTLRVEEFSVRNGPDLFVYLSPTADGEDAGALNLGDLKATDGAFNYEIPTGTDISAFKYAIVWCRQFETLFASAELSALQP